MSIIKATKDKVSKDISFIFYENNKIPRYRKIDKFSFSFLTYGPAFLTLISINENIFLFFPDLLEPRSTFWS